MIYDAYDALARVGGTRGGRDKKIRKVHVISALIISMDIASISHVDPAMAGMACTFPCQASRAWLLQEQMQR